MGPTLRELCLNESPATFPAVAWYAVMVKGQQERAVHGAFQQKKIESFLPLYWAARRWSDRVKKLQLPLFPGYLFSRFSSTQRLDLLRTPGVKQIVSNGSKITPVADDDIERVQRLVSSDCPLETWPFLQAGQRVRVQCGPLEGLEGTFEESRGGCRVLVGLELLQRSVVVHLAREHVRPI